MDCLRTESTADGGEVFIFGIDDNNAYVLAHQQEPWVLNMDTDSRRIQYAGKKALDKRAEAAGLATRMDRVTVEDGNLESS